MQRLTSCDSLKTKKDWTFQLLLHRLPRAMSPHHAKTINVSGISVVCTPIPKYQSKKQKDIVSVTLYCNTTNRVEEKHKS